MTQNLIRLQDCAVTPWANGGGVTTELAAKRVGEHVVWRISVARIDRDGPFSRFPGMARVHTIIEGAGLDLLGDSGVLPARPFLPVSFDGALALNARLLGGPCRALNVIYDPKIVVVVVNVFVNDQEFEGAAGEFVFVVSGMVHMSDKTQLVAGDAMTLNAAVTISPAAGAKILRVCFGKAPI